MRIVRDQTGTHYVVLSATESVCRLREIRSGAEVTRQCESLQPADPAAALAATGVDADGVDTVTSAARTSRAIGLLVELDAAGPLAVRTILDRFDVCESDLHGMVTELRAAGLLEPTTVYGERGYRVTDAARDVLETSV